MNNFINISSEEFSKKKDSILKELEKNKKLIKGKTALINAQEKLSDLEGKSKTAKKEESDISKLEKVNSLLQFEIAFLNCLKGIKKATFENEKKFIMEGLEFSIKRNSIGGNLENNLTSRILELEEEVKNLSLENNSLKSGLEGVAETFHNGVKQTA